MYIAFTSFCYIKNIIYVLKIYKKITAGIFPDTSAVNSAINFHYQLGLFILLATNSRRISRHIFVSRPIFLFVLLCLVLFLSQAWKPRKSAIFGTKKPPSPRLAMSAKTAISSARSGVRTLDTLIKRHSQRKTRGKFFHIGSSKPFAFSNNLFSKNPRRNPRPLATNKPFFSWTTFLSTNLS